MRHSPSLILFLLALGCGGASQGALPTLTVNNTLGWCTVTVVVGSAAPQPFTSDSHQFQASAGTIVTLNAVPLPTFLAATWTGTTTTTGADATYVMTAAASQAVTACCPLSTGSGC